MAGDSIPFQLSAKHSRDGYATFFSTLLLNDFFFFAIFAFLLRLILIFGAEAHGGTGHNGVQLTSKLDTIVTGLLHSIETLKASVPEGVD